MNNSTAAPLSPFSPEAMVWGQLVLGSVRVSVGALGGIGNIVFFTALTRTPALRSALAGGALTRLGCFWGIIYPRTLTGNAGAGFILAASVDRLLLLKAPVSHWTTADERYIGGWVCGSVIYGLYVATDLAVRLPPDSPVPLCAADFVLSRMRSLHLLYIHVLLSSVIIGVSLCVAWLSGRPAAGKKAAQLSEKALAQRKRFQQSQLLVIVIYVSSWVMTLAGRIVRSKLRIPGPLVFFAGQTVDFLLLSVNLFSNVIIYYVRNPEYRKACRVVVGLKEKHSSVVVQPLNA